MSSLDFLYVLVYYNHALLPDIFVIIERAWMV